MKKYAVFVKGLGECHRECDTLKQAKAFKEYLIKEKKARLKMWTQELKRLEQLEYDHKKLKKQVNDTIDCITKTIDNIENNTHIYKLVK